MRNNRMGGLAAFAILAACCRCGPVFARANGSGDTVRAGWFEKVISNEIGTGIAGYDGTDVAKAKLDDLLLCGLCIDDGKSKALILSLDLFSESIFKMSKLFKI